MTAEVRPREPTLFGHPPGLFTLFFAEMWERFSYYGMRALLIFYMLKGFLRYDDQRAYAVYGAYTALVYMTPFFGGMLADRLLGSRRAVVVGGLLMASGHLLMTLQTDIAFFGALGLLVAGNGFFKPNISTMVGSLYPAGSPLRDGGFTLFYMGINLGAALSPLLCGYIGETYGWHYGFGLATLGMLSGLSIFVAPLRVAQVVIGSGALVTALALLVFRPANPYSFGVNVFVAAALLAAASVAWVALGRGGIPASVGTPPDPERLKRRVGPLSAEWAVYAGALVLVPVVALLISGFSPFTADKQPVLLLSQDFVKGLQSSPSGVVRVLAVVAEEISRPAGLILTLTGVFAVGYLGRELFRLGKVERERLSVALILTFFSMLFWSFFEQAGSSLNNFTDRNVDRVTERRSVTAADVGQTLRFEPTQEQVGYKNGEQVFTLRDLDALRAKNEGNPRFEIDWQVTPENVGMGIGERSDEVPASVFQATNAVFILIFGLVLTSLWGFLAKRKLEPSTPVKFALGLLQLSLGFVAIWYGARVADSRGLVGALWLVVGYLLHTTGELCLSPVGLSMITKLSPRVLVSTVMGNWFLASAFAQYLAAIISQFTSVGHGADGKALSGPQDTLFIYGDVFGKIAIVSFGSALVCFALAPILKRWMHEGESR